MRASVLLLLVPALAHADPPQLAATAQVSYYWLDLPDPGGSEGALVAGTIGFHTDPTTVVGLRLSYGRTTGTYSDTFTPPTPYDASAIIAAVFAHGEALDTLWADVFLGASIDDFHLHGAGGMWTTGLGLGLVGGADVVKIRHHRFGLIGTVESELSGGSHEALALGVAYRYE